MKARSSAWPHVLLALWCATTLAALTWPVYGWLGNSIDPLVLGLPFSLAWVIGWALATFVFLSVYYVWTEREA